MARGQVGHVYPRLAQRAPPISPTPIIPGQLEHQILDRLPLARAARELTPSGTIQRAGGNPPVQAQADLGAKEPL